MSEHIVITDQCDTNEIELRLLESMRIHQSGVDQLRANYEESVRNLNTTYDNNIDVLRQMQYTNQGLEEHINSLIKQMEISRHNAIELMKHEHIIKVADFGQEKISLIKHQQTMVDSVMSKINTPSFDLEFGIAIGILLHHDNSYIPEDAASYDAIELLRRYLTQEVLRASTCTQKLFEEHLISKAKSVLFNTLKQRAIPFGCSEKKIEITPKPDTNGIKLIDTDILHSHDMHKL
jgi:hypothetical protein